MKRIYDKQRLERYFKEHNLSELIDEELENHVEIQFFQKEELVLKAGEKLNYYYLLVEGKIKVSYLFENGKSMLMKVYSAFNVIGDIEIMKNQPVRCDVEAITDTYLVTIPADLIRKSYMNNVRFLQHLVLSLSTKLEATINNISYNFIYPLKNRLASYLMEYLKEEDQLNKKSEKNSEVSIILTASFKEISQLLGTTYRHLNRTFNELEEEGIVKTEDRKISILDEFRLRELSKNDYIL